MADTIDTLIASACLAVKEQFQDNIFSKSKLLTELWANRRSTDGGSQIQIPIRWSKGNTVGTRTSGSEFTFAETDTVKTPALDWVYYGATGQLPFEKMAMASGKHRVLDLFKIEVSRIERELHEYIATDFFGNGATGRTPPGITGLTAICSSSNTYGGYDRTALASTHPWVGHTASQASLTDLELSQYIDVCNVRGFEVNQIWTTKAVKSLMRHAWGTAVQRFIGGKMMNIGAADFDFNGIPVYSDELITANSVLLLCTETLNFVTPTGSDPFEIESFRNESQFKGVRLRVAPMIQLECVAPYHNYLITDVTACATS